MPVTFLSGNHLFSHRYHACTDALREHAMSTICRHLRARTMCHVRAALGLHRPRYDTSPSIASSCAWRCWSYSGISNCSGPFIGCLPASQCSWLAMRSSKPTRFRPGLPHVMPWSVSRAAVLQKISLERDMEHRPCSADAHSAFEVSCRYHCTLHAGPFPGAVSHWETCPQIHTWAHQAGGGGGHEVGAQRSFQRKRRMTSSEASHCW